MPDRGHDRGKPDHDLVCGEKIPLLRPGRLVNWSTLLYASLLHLTPYAYPIWHVPVTGTLVKFEDERYNIASPDANAVTMVYS